MDDGNGAGGNSAPGQTTPQPGAGGIKPSVAAGADNSGVELGDHVYVQHPRRGPIAVKGLAHGRDALQGERHKVLWSDVLGHKGRQLQDYIVVTRVAMVRSYRTPRAMAVKRRKRMKLTEESADYQDSRPRTGRSNLSIEFQEKMVKRLAEGEVAASPEVSPGTTHRRSRSKKRLPEDRK